jgi:hypothetical protein
MTTKQLIFRTKTAEAFGQYLDSIGEKQIKVKGRD